MKFCWIYSTITTPTPYYPTHVYFIVQIWQSQQRSSLPFLQQPTLRISHHCHGDLWLLPQSVGACGGPKPDGCVQRQLCGLVSL